MGGHDAITAIKRRDVHFLTEDDVEHPSASLIEIPEGDFCRLEVRVA